MMKILLSMPEFYLYCVSVGGLLLLALLEPKKACQVVDRALEPPAPIYFVPSENLFTLAIGTPLRMGCRARKARNLSPPTSTE
jgi:hypothetical protein